MGAARQVGGEVAARIPLRRARLVHDNAQGSGAWNRPSSRKWWSGCSFRPSPAVSRTLPPMADGICRRWTRLQHRRCWSCSTCLTWVGRHAVPIIHVAACQPTASWRPIPVEVASGGSIRTIEFAVRKRLSARRGRCLASGRRRSSIWSTRSRSISADAEHWLENRDNDAMANGANLAVLGKEILQFGTVTPVGGNRVRLSRLLRGRRGSEWAMAGHAAGEKFAPSRPNALRAVELGLETLGTSIAVKAAGLADAQVHPTQMHVSGEGLRPPSPVHLRAGRTESGDVRAIWRRRSRAGWAWLDGLDDRSAKALSGIA